MRLLRRTNDWLNGNTALAFTTLAAIVFVVCVVVIALQGEPQA